jgi:hypothetical protein
LQRIQIQWEHALRKALLELLEVLFDEASEEGLRACCPRAGPRFAAS